MNIFVLDLDPVKAAEYHCDKHVIKMILETGQLLSTTCRYFDIDYGYKKTHVNHPCAIWARQSYQNILWLQRLGIELCFQYTKRYFKLHKSLDVILQLPLDEIREKFGKNNIELNNMTRFALAMPEQYKTNDVVESYRNYYIHEKKDICTWKIDKPVWFINATS